MKFLYLIPLLYMPTLHALQKYQTPAHKKTSLIFCCCTNKAASPIKKQKVPHKLTPLYALLLQETTDPFNTVPSKPSAQYMFPLATIIEETKEDTD